MEDSHACVLMPINVYIEDRYIIYRGFDMSVEKSDYQCNFCPFCGKVFNKVVLKNIGVKRW